MSNNDKAICPMSNNDKAIESEYKRRIQKLKLKAKKRKEIIKDQAQTIAEMSAKMADLEHVNGGMLFRQSAVSVRATIARKTHPRISTRTAGSMSILQAWQGPESNEKREVLYFDNENGNLQSCHKAITKVIEMTNKLAHPNTSEAAKAYTIRKAIAYAKQKRLLESDKMIAFRAASKRLRTERGTILVLRYASLSL